MTGALAEKEEETQPPHRVSYAMLALALSLSACCQNNDADCTETEIAHKNAEREYWHNAATVPELVSSQDGVKLYRIWTVEPSYRLENHWTYFTAPCGDVDAELTWNESHGKTSSIEHQQLHTAGSGCK